MSAILAALWQVFVFCWAAIASLALAAILYSAIAQNYEIHRQRPSWWRRRFHCSKNDHRETVHQSFGFLVLRCHDCQQETELGHCSILMDCPRQERSA